MTKEQYKKLNYYLNGSFKELEILDYFFLDNIEAFARMSDEYVVITDNYEFERMPKANKMTYEDVYLLGREIVESINKDYLKYYDELISAGKLDFGYEADSEESVFVDDIEFEKKRINVKRNFNYIDVAVLIHEFMHYISHMGKINSVNNHVLTEAISIYFEEYAKRYLIKKGIPKEELYLDERIKYTRMDASRLNSYSLVMLAYEKFGSINEETYKLLKEFYCNVTEEEFNKDCENVLKFCEECEDSYKWDYKMQKGEDEPDYYEEFLFKRLTNHLKNYRYIFGTVVAYNALKYSSLENMVYLIDHINDENYANMDPLDILETIGINIETLDLEVIKEVLDEIDSKEKTL